MRNLAAAKSVISVVHSIAEGRYGYYKMPVELRHIRNTILETLSGLELAIVDGRYTVRRDGLPVTENESLKHIEKVAENINRWIYKEASLDVPRLCMNHYSPIILDRLGIDPGAIAELMLVLHSLEIETPMGRLKIYRNSDYLRMEYRSGPMLWADGRVRLKSKGLPNVARIALRGHRLSKIIDDPLVGDSIIRHVGSGKRNDNHFQVLLLREGILA